jgi:2,3-bisphosphoglycerate-independent phosphoglycerate mutase
VHFKETDRAGEDGDFEAKVGLIERFDGQVVPRLVRAGADVLCITGDHSTPALMAGHSWHAVPVLLHSRFARHTSCAEGFSELACGRGDLGIFYSRQLMGLLLAHAGRLAKFGA